MEDLTDCSREELLAALAKQIRAEAEQVAARDNEFTSEEFNECADELTYQICEVVKQELDDAVQELLSEG